MNVKKLWICLTCLMFSLSLVMPQTIHAQQNPINSTLEEQREEVNVEIDEQAQIETRVKIQQEETMLDSANMLKSQYQPYFTVRVRNCMTLNPEIGTSYLQEQPATYRIEREDGRLSFFGTSTTFDTYNNFVHWTMEKGEGNYFQNGDNTRLLNLPEGNYTVTRLFAGKNITPSFYSSSTPYLNASNLKYSTTEDPFTTQSYSFTVNEELVDELMHDVYTNQQSYSVFFGFYGTVPDPNVKLFLRYDANGGYGTMQPMRNLPQNSSVNLTKNEFYSYDSTFVGWNTVAKPTPENPGGFYNDEAEVKLTDSNVVLYAQWKEKVQFSHIVYICDLINGKSSQGGRKTVDINGLAYTDEELNAIVEKYLLKNNYGSEVSKVKTEIRVRQGAATNPDEWNLYVPGSEFKITRVLPI